MSDEEVRICHAGDCWPPTCRVCAAEESLEVVGG